MPISNTRVALDIGALYGLHAQTVARWAERLGGPATDVDDVVHEVFLIAHRRLGSWSEDAQITTWLFRTTWKVVSHRRRRERIRRALRLSSGYDADVRSVAQPTPLEELERRRRVAAAYRILDGMSAKHRVVLVLYEIEGRSGEEIASLTGSKLSTVWVRLHRARAQFFEQLRAMESEEPK